MKRKTLKQQWDELKIVLEAKEAEYLKRVFPGGVPCHIFRRASRNKVEQLKIERFWFWHGWVSCYYGKKPTRTELGAWKRYVEGGSVFNEASIILCCRTTDGSDITSTIRLIRMRERMFFFFSYDEALAFMER
jgi:hypothetical protein